MKKLALVVSRIFDPIIEIPFILATVVALALVNGLRWRFLTLLLFLDAMLPATVFGYLIQTGQAGGVDFRNKKARQTLFTFALFCNAAGVGTAYLIDRHPLAEILLTFWVLGLVYVSITYFWKISVHMGVNATLATVGVELLGRDWVWLFSVPLLVAWARIVGRQHNILQVIVGGAIPIIVVPMCFRLLGVS
jgi:membrane-associated phospholipid phosphatase